MVGDRLRLARESAGMSLRDLEAATNRVVSAQAISKYERNLMKPTGDVLVALAGALGVSSDYLKSRREIQLSGVEFRKATHAGAKDERVVRARLLEVLERYLVVEEALNLPSGLWSLHFDSFSRVSNLDDAEHCAQFWREKWLLGTSPIPHLTDVLEGCGIKIIPLALPVAVSGTKALVSLVNAAPAPTIVINVNHTGERQRFTLAHELGHLILEGVELATSLDIERAADRFAGAFLVPSREMRHVVGERRQELPLGELVELKKYFKVSLQCLIVRARQCDVIDQAGYRRHWTMLKAAGYLDPPYSEPAPQAPEFPRRLHRLVLRAIAEGALTKAQALAALNVDSETLQRLLADGENVLEY